MTYSEQQEYKNEKNSGTEIFIENNFTGQDISEILAEVIAERISNEISNKFSENNFQSA